MIQKNGRAIGCLAWFAFSSAALSGAGPRADFLEGAHEFRLANGLRFAHLERTHSPLISFHVLVGAGVADEPEGMSGLATLLPALFMRGSEVYGTRDAAAEKAGLQKAEKFMDQWSAEVSKGNPLLGQEPEIQAKMALDEATRHALAADYHQISLNANAASGSRIRAEADCTSFSFTLLSNRAEYWFRLYSEWLRRPSWRFFYADRSALRDTAGAQQSSFQRDARLAEALLQAAFPKHPYAKTIPLAAEVATLRPAGMELYWKTNFTPSNTVIAIVGDLPLAEARRLAELYFARIPAAPVPTRPRLEPLKLDGPRRLPVNLEASPSVVLAWYRPGRDDPDDAVYDVLLAALTGGRESFLQRELSGGGSPGGAVNIRHFFPGERYQNLFVLERRLPPTISFAEGERSLDAALQKFRQEVTPRTVEAAQARIRLLIAGRMQSSAALAEQLARGVSGRGSLEGYQESLRRLGQVTPADVRRVLERNLTTRDRFVLTVGREGASYSGGEN